MSYILGIHLGHDATACLINDKGDILAAVAEERLTRVKYHTGFPYKAIEEVLSIAKISKGDISHITYGANVYLSEESKEVNDILFSKDYERLKKIDLFNNSKLNHPVIELFNVVKRKITYSNKVVYTKNAKEYTLYKIKEECQKIGFSTKSINSVEHHLSHASSAYYTAGFNNPLIITIDGSGDGLCASASIMVDNKIKRVSSSSSNVSPGRVYSEITRFLGFKRNRHEGKITGLAAFGNYKKTIKLFEEFLYFNQEAEEFDYNKIKKSKVNKKISTVKKIINNTNQGLDHISDMSEILSKRFNKERDFKDLAAGVQKHTEDICVQYVSHFLNKHPRKNIVLAGGIFANVRVNQELSRIKNIDNIFIHQNMGDGGCSTGSALYFLYEKLNVKYEMKSPSNVYFGRAFEKTEIEKEIQKHKLKFEKFDSIEKEIAAQIHKGNVIGRFNGGMEYGPRALGNRSIIASPTDKKINDWLNKKLNRTEFMPFAPSVLKEHANTIFKNFKNSPGTKAANFMTITYDVMEEWRSKIQATTHIDGTARPQIVSIEQNPSFHKIISEYYKLSKIPVVINTSFNMHEEPIVATPEDAIRAFNQGAMDFLAIGNFLCYK
tara:strand:+ start:17243 stop:19066 length:1824 start_codon:yes stop_codon:yes gene_type:complete